MNRESINRFVAGTRRRTVGETYPNRLGQVKSLTIIDRRITPLSSTSSIPNQYSSYSSYTGKVMNTLKVPVLYETMMNTLLINTSSRSVVSTSSQFSSSFRTFSTTPLSQRSLSTSCILTKPATLILDRNESILHLPSVRNSVSPPNSSRSFGTQTKKKKETVGVETVSSYSFPPTDTTDNLHINAKAKDSVPSPKPKASHKRSRTPVSGKSTSNTEDILPSSTTPLLGSSTTSNNSISTATSVSIETKLNQLESFFELWSPPIVTQDFQPLLYEYILNLSTTSSSTSVVELEQVLGGRFPLLHKYIQEQIQPIINLPSVSSSSDSKATEDGKKKKSRKSTSSSISSKSSLSTSPSSSSSSLSSVKVPSLPTVLIHHLQSSSFLRNEFKQLVDVLIDLRLQFLLCLSKDILPDRILILSKQISTKSLLASLGNNGSKETGTINDHHHPPKRKLSTDAITLLQSLTSLASPLDPLLSSSSASSEGSSYVAIHNALKRNLRIDEGAYQQIETEAYIMALSIFSLRLRRILSQSINTLEIEQLYKQGYDTAGDYTQLDKIPLISGLRNLLPDTILEFSNNCRSIFEHTLVASTNMTLLTNTLSVSNTGTRAWKALETTIMGQQVPIIDARDRLITVFNTLQSPTNVQIAQLLAIFVGDKQLINAVEQIKVRLMARAAVNIGNTLLSKLKKDVTKSDIGTELKELKKLGTKLVTPSSTGGKGKTKSANPEAASHTVSSSLFSLPYYSRQSWQHILNESVSMALHSVSNDSVNKPKLQKELQSLLNTVNIRTTIDNALPEKSRGAKQEVREAALHGSIVTKYERIMHQLLVSLQNGKDGTLTETTMDKTHVLQFLRKEDNYTVFSLSDAVQSLQHTVVPQLFGQDKFAYTGFWRVLESGSTAITTKEQAKQLLEIAEMVTLITEGYEPVDVLQKKKEVRITNAIVKQKSKGKFKSFPTGSVAGSYKHSIPSPLIDSYYDTLSNTLLKRISHRDIPNAYYLIQGGIHFLRPGDVRLRFNALLGSDITTILGASDATSLTNDDTVVKENITVSPWKKISEETKSVLSQLNGTTATTAVTSSAKSVAPTEQELLEQLRSQLQPIFNLHPLPSTLRRFDNLSNDCRGLLLSFAIRLCLVVPDSTLLDIRKALDKAMHELHSAGNFRPAHYTPYTSTLSSHSGSAASQKQIAAGVRMEVSKLPVPSPGTILHPMSLIFRALGPVAFLYMPTVTFLVTHAWLTPHVVDLARAVVIHAFSRPSKETEEPSVVDQLLKSTNPGNSTDEDSVFTKVIQELRNTRHPHLKLREDSRPSDVMVVTQKLRELIHAKGDEIGLPEHRRKLWENIKSEKLKSLAYLIGEQANKIDALASEQQKQSDTVSKMNGNHTTIAASDSPLVLDQLLKDPLPGAEGSTLSIPVPSSTSDISPNETLPLHSSFIPASTGSMHFTTTRVAPIKTEGTLSWEIYNTPDTIRRKVAIFRLPIMGLTMKNEVVAQLQREIAIAEGGVRGKLLLRQNLKQAGKNEQEIQSVLKDVKVDQPTPARATLLLGERMSEERLMESIKHLGEIQKIDLQWEWAKAYEEEIWGSLYPSFKKWASRQTKTKTGDSNVVKDGIVSINGDQSNVNIDSIDEEAAYTNIYGTSGTASAMDNAILDEENFDEELNYSDMDETEEVYDETIESSFAASSSSAKGKPSSSSSAVLAMGTDRKVLPRDSVSSPPSVRNYSTLTVRINNGGTITPSYFPSSSLPLFSTLHTFAGFSFFRSLSTESAIPPTTTKSSTKKGKGKKKTVVSDGLNENNVTDIPVDEDTNSSLSASTAKASGTHYSPRSYANQLSSTNNLQPIVAMRYGRKKDGELLKRYIRNFNIRSELHGFIYFHNPVAAQQACSSTLRHFGVVIDSASSCRVRPASELRSLVLRRIPPGLTVDSVLIILRYMLQSIGLTVQIATLPRFNYITDGSVLTSIHRPLSSTVPFGMNAYNHRTSSGGGTTATMLTTKHRILIDFPTHEDAVQAYHALQNIQLADWGLSRGQSLVVGWPTPEQVVSLQNAAGGSGNR